MNDIANMRSTSFNWITLASSSLLVLCLWLPSLKWISFTRCSIRSNLFKQSTWHCWMGSRTCRKVACLSIDDLAHDDLDWTHPMSSCTSAATIRFFFLLLPFVSGKELSPLAWDSMLEAKRGRWRVLLSSAFLSTLITEFVRAATIGVLWRVLFWIKKSRSYCRTSVRGSHGLQSACL